MVDVDRLAMSLTAIDNSDADRLSFMAVSVRVRWSIWFQSTTSGCRR